MMMSKHPNYGILVAITIISASAIIMASLIVTPAFAIKWFFNCMTDDTNKNGQLTINEVNLCYDKEYHSGPFATHSRSASSSSGSSK
jgi:hypothetical protein